VALGRILLAWVAVAAWLLGWRWAEPRTVEAVGDIAGEALLVTLFGSLWFASLGAGAWWLPFLLVGALREWPIRSIRGGLRIFRLLGAGGLLAWVLPG
jgi:hypothetical protein